MDIRPAVLIAILLLLAGCSSFDFRRLAPPGILKYERIADEKAPNPAIQEQIDAYRQSGNAVFPKIGETAAATQTVSRPNVAQAEEEITELESARRSLEDAVADDRAAAELDRETQPVLSGEAPAPNQTDSQHNQES